MLKRKKQNEEPFVFDIASNIDRLVKTFPQFQGTIHTQNDKKYGRSVTLSMRNVSNPRFPLIVTMYEKDGMYLDMGRLNTVAEYETDMDDFLDCISEILEDRVYVTVCYATEEDFQAQRNYRAMRSDCRIDEPGREWEDSFSEYKSFLEKLRTNSPRFSGRS